MDARIIIPIALGLGIYLLLRSSESGAADRLAPASWDTPRSDFNPQSEIYTATETGGGMSDEEYRAILIANGYDPAAYGYRPIDESDWGSAPAPGGTARDPSPSESGSAFPEYNAGAQIIEFPGVFGNAHDAADPFGIPSPSPYPGETLMDQERNLAAFLMTIRYAEGTAGPNGYRTMFGGELFDSYADHPRRAITRKLGGKPITSTAAGAYQFLTTTWDEAANALGLPDFSPDSQDQAAVFLIRRRGALEDVLAGNFERAIAKLNKEWASLPGSPYGQPTKPLPELISFYNGRGGEVAA